MTDTRPTAGIAHLTVIPGESSRGRESRRDDGARTNVDGPHVTVVPREQ